MKKRLESFRHAFRGIREFIGSCTNAKIQIICGVITVLLGIILEFTKSEWIAVTICIGMVLSAEAMNSALEEIADEISEERRPKIRKAKDMAAGSVLLVSIVSAVVGIVILSGHI